MGTIVIKLVAEALANPDLDIRYALPDLLVERSGGVVRDDGYDYASDGAALLIFLRADRTEEAVASVIDVIENVHVLGNDLRSAAAVTVEDAGRSEVVYPRKS
jgi:hypothetical protein